MSIFSLIQANKANTVLAALAGAVFAFLGLVFFGGGFSVRTDYLVIQQSAEKQDFYTLSKSVEYSGNILKEAIQSNLFFSEAAASNFFSAQAFSSDEKDRLKEWRKSLSINQRPSAGILEVTVTRDSKDEAAGIARAISSVLIEKNELFRSGTKESLTIKTISGPIVEQNPSKREIAFGAVAGALCGGSLSLVWAMRKMKKLDALFGVESQNDLQRVREMEERKLNAYREQVLRNEHFPLPNSERGVPDNLPYSV